MHISPAHGGVPSYALWNAALQGPCTSKANIKASCVSCIGSEFPDIPWGNRSTGEVAGEILRFASAPHSLCGHPPGQRRLAPITTQQKVVLKVLHSCLHFDFEIVSWCVVCFGFFSVHVTQPPLTTSEYGYVIIGAGIAPAIALLVMGGQVHAHDTPKIQGDVPL